MILDDIYKLTIRRPLAQFGLEGLINIECWYEEDATASLLAVYIYLEEGASMSEMELKRMRELDEAAENAGGFLVPLTRLDTSYDYRALVKYCHERKIEPLDITIRELRQFALSE